MSIARQEIPTRGKAPAPLSESSDLEPPVRARARGRMKITPHHVGDRIGIMQVLTEPTPEQVATGYAETIVYRVRYTCCGTEVERTHRQLGRHGAELCVDCYKRSRRQPPADEGLNLPLFAPAPSSRVRPEVATAAAERRAATLARIARIQAGLAPTAPPSLPVVTQAFAGHPRTLAEALARAEAYRSRAS